MVARVNCVSFDTVWSATKFVPFVPSVPILEQGLFYRIEFRIGSRGGAKCLICKKRRRRYYYYL